MKEDCLTTLERTYLYLDGELLSAAERHEIKVHLEQCGPCYERFGLERRITLVVARLQHHARCPQSLRARILSTLLEEEPK